MQAVYGVVKNITIFLILVTVVMNLFSNKVYYKYVSVFVGMVLILIVIQPFITWFKGEDVLSSQIELSGFMIDNSEWESKVKIAEESGRARVMKEYKERIQEQVALILSNHQLHLKQMDIQMEEEEDSENYGSLVLIQIVATRVKEEGETEEGKTEEGKGKITIDKIRITEEGDVEENDAEVNLSSALLAEQIQKELSTLYRMEPKNIHIRIMN